VHAYEQAVARFLHAYLPRLPGDLRWPWMAEKERLESEIQALRERLKGETRAHAQIGRELESRLAAAQAQLASAAGERDRFAAALADISNQLADVKRSRLLRWCRRLRRSAGLPVPY
jgi:septal ring factor EnvC (AmiA/AmiB activator)